MVGQAEIGAKRHGPRRPTRRPKGPAYHEAGHVVIQVAIGRAPTAVVTHRDGSGLTEGRGEPLSLKSQYEVWDLISMNLAGIFAEARATKVSRFALSFGVGREDYDAAGAPIKWLVAEGYAVDLDAAWRRAEAHTRALVARHWAAIVGVAEQLRVSGRLDAASVQEIIQNFVTASHP